MPAPPAMPESQWPLGPTHAGMAGTGAAGFSAPAPVCAGVTWGSLVEVEPTTCPHRRPGRGRSSFWGPRPRRDGRNRSGRVRHAGAPAPRLNLLAVSTD